MTCLERTQSMQHEATKHDYGTTNGMHGALFTTGVHGFMEAETHPNPTMNLKQPEMGLIGPGLISSPPWSN